ncbi:MAG: DUF2249 domain-containing protein [Betaproteobacteria bacterium]|nr:DUF2249 domain-containing protein [Betaproteobacteria bacterium]
MSCSQDAVAENGVFPFDARAISKRFRHAAIFGALESLGDGDVMRFMNDHDPLPLLQQIQHRYGPQVEVNYVERDPGNIVIDFKIRLQSGAGCGESAGSGGCGCC